MIGSTPQHRGTPKDGHHPRTNTRPRKAAILAGASGVLAEIQANRNADAATGTMAKHKILQTTPKVLRWKGKKDSREGKKGIEEDGVAVRDTKENAFEQESAMDFVATEKRPWELHRLFNNRKGSLSSTYKNTEANTKVYDLNLREPSLF